MLKATQKDVLERYGSLPSAEITPQTRKLARAPRWISEARPSLGHPKLESEWSFVFVLLRPQNGTIRLPEVAQASYLPQTRGRTCTYRTHRRMPSAIHT